MKAEGIKLAQGQSVAQLVIGQILNGIKVTVVVDGKEYEGLVNNFDIAPNKSDHLFAMVHVPDIGGEEGLDIKVAMFANGDVEEVPQRES